jgi:hypothetical protein
MLSKYQKHAIAQHRASHGSQLHIGCFEYVLQTVDPPSVRSWIKVLRYLVKVRSSPIGAGGIKLADAAGHVTANPQSICSL